MSSAPSSTTSSEAARCAPSDVEIGFAEDTDASAIELHRYLCLISGPALLAPIDPQDSMNGVLDVLKSGFAVTARADGHLVGSLGVIRVPFYYNRKFFFMTDRWYFSYPEFRNTSVGARMLLEAHAVAIGAGCELIITGHLKRRGNCLSFTKPMVLGVGTRFEPEKGGNG